MTTKEGVAVAEEPKKKKGNRNYLRGRSREYRTMDKLRAEGFDIVLRSAGSHSQIDVMGINTSTKIIRFIQNKPKSMGPKARDRIAENNKKLNDEYLCTFEVI